ncbi:MAG TPA: 30S ribosomal protein S20 [Thermomicrobiales bacterium]|nr:30S ribosomal protein S20 [Thermomicrobiales bacterium]
MANSRSARKRIRVNERRRLRNQSYKSATRTLVRKAERAIVGGISEDTAVTVGEALSRLDKAAAKGIIHRNAAARKKSRLMARFNKAAGVGKAVRAETGEA